jgi:hypothetical protein
VTLYVSEKEIALEVLGPDRASEWRGIATILERNGFPKVDPLFGGRYMPAVRAWLDAYNRVGNITPPRRRREQWPERATPRGSNGESARTADVCHIGSRGQT